MVEPPRIDPVERRSLGDAVFQQLRDQIVAGRLAPGALMPPERELVAAFGVNRGAVREALKRLEQMRLVSMQQGGRTRVRDFRADAGLELLPALLVRPEGGLDARALRGLAEMRSALGADAARLAATRGGPAAAARLEAALEALQGGGDDLPALQHATWTLWDAIIESADNLPYRLAFNSLRESWRRFQDLMAPVMADELRDVAGAETLVQAIAAGDAAGAEAAARALVGRGAAAIARLARDLERVPAPEPAG